MNLIPGWDPECNGSKWTRQWSWMILWPGEDYMSAMDLKPSIIGLKYWDPESCKPDPDEILSPWIEAWTGNDRLDPVTGSTDLHRILKPWKWHEYWSACAMIRAMIPGWSCDQVKDLTWVQWILNPQSSAWILSILKSCEPDPDEIRCAMIRAMIPGWSCDQVKDLTWVHGS